LDFFLEFLVLFLQNGMSSIGGLGRILIQPDAHSLAEAPPLPKFFFIYF
jgi:hypothetical protein